MNNLDLLAGFMLYELGEGSLQNAPVLLMGFGSVARSPLLRGREVELSNLRRRCHKLSSHEAIKREAIKRMDSLHNSKERLFIIDEKTLAIQPMWDLIPQELTNELDKLKKPHEQEEHKSKIAQTDRRLKIAFPNKEKYGGKYAIQNLPPAIPLPDMHDENRRPKGRIVVSWDDLIHEAEEMDRIDKEDQVVRPGNWRKRLEAATLRQVGNDGQLYRESHLKLDGVKHLIGLPGAGKTTLLMCLLRYLGRREIKTAVFFPTIEVSRQYLDNLRQYGVEAGLLVGQSASTKSTHAKKLAETMSNGEKYGLGEFSESAYLIEGVCGLPALSEGLMDQLAPKDIKILTGACSSIYSEEDGYKESYLCPAWSLCGLKKSAAELPKKHIWLGHIISTDTTVPKHTTRLKDIRYFELVARSFDVVVVDEADLAQEALDGYGVANIKVAGDPGALRESGLQDYNLKGQSESGSTAFEINQDLRDLDMAYDRFRFIISQGLIDQNKKLQDRIYGRVLTPYYIIQEIFNVVGKDKIDQEEHGGAAGFINAVYELWDQASYNVYHERSSGEREETERDFDSRYDLLYKFMLDWLTYPKHDLKKFKKFNQDVLDCLLNFQGAEVLVNKKQVENHKDQLAGMVALLLAVTFTIRIVMKIEYNPEFREKTSTSTPSPPLSLATPNNIVGRRFAGVRINRNREGHLDQLQYVVFNAAPRMLLYRIHEWSKSEGGQSSGPAVLLTSATSFFPESTSFHIDVTPNYALKRLKPEREDAADSHYEFRPIKDNDKSSPIMNGKDEFLRVSGGGMEEKRTENLKKMAEALLEGGPSESLVARDCAQFDVRDGIKRKAGFVVNSYEQAENLKRFIDSRFGGEWRSRVVAVVRELPDDTADKGGYITAPNAESLGDNEKRQIIIFPAGALSRGTNMVFTKGPRNRDAAIGTLYFLTRPYPPPNDIGFLTSVIAKKTMDFDRKNLDFRDMDELSGILKDTRGDVYRLIDPLIKRPLMMDWLTIPANGELYDYFAGNYAVRFFQTIGRAMRNGCPVQCFFVDAAWAINSARNEKDDEKSSFLIKMRRLIENGINASDKREAALYRELYGEFLKPLSRIKGLIENG